MQVKLFFSHAWADKEFGSLKFLQNKLNASFDLWIDRKQLDPGVHIESEIEKGIRDCDIYLIAWSKAAEASKAVQFELTTAKSFGKPIVICVIDGHSTAQSELLRGYKYLSFTGDPLSDEAEWNRLHNFLLKRDPELLKEGAGQQGIKKQLDQLSDINAELEDLIYRYREQVSGNNAGNEYIQSALDEFVKLFGSEEDRKMRLFAEAAQSISVAYPLGKDDSRKQQLLLQAILTIDPEGTEVELQDLKQFLEQQAVLDAEDEAERQKSNSPAFDAGSTDTPMVNQLKVQISGKKLLAMQTSNSGTGETYSSSSDVVHLQLFADGRCYFRLVSSNYASQLGVVENSNEQSGKWQLHEKNGELMIWFAWSNGTNENLKINLEAPKEVILNGVRYAIVDLNYEV